MARRLHTLAFLAVGPSLAGPVLAQTAQTGLSVSATVQPTCIARTAPAGTANLACSHLGGGQVEIRRSDAPLTATSHDASRSGAPRADSRVDGLTYVTITY